MTFSIEHPEAEQLARELAATTGEPLDDAVLAALRERLDRERLRRPGIGARLRRLAEETMMLPATARHRTDENVGYDADGLPS